MACESGSTELVLVRLEAALRDLEAFDGELNDPDGLGSRGRAAFRAAFTNLNNNAVWLRDTVEELTGERQALLNGHLVTPLSFALEAGYDVQTPELVAARLSATGKFGTWIRRAIATVKQGDSFAKRNRMPGTPHDERRLRILEVMDRSQRAGAYDTSAQAISTELGLPSQDVEEDLELLESQGRVTMTSTVGEVAAKLTPEGRQWVREGVISRPYVHQSNTFLAPVGTLNLAQSGSGDVFQHIEQPSNLTEIRQLLTAMKSIIARSELSDDTREEALVYVQQIIDELRTDKPRPSMLKVPWTGLGRIADLIAIAGAAGGPASLPDIYERARPLMESLLKVAGGG